jgi:hypothetical protein
MQGLAIGRYAIALALIASSAVVVALAARVDLRSDAVRPERLAQDAARAVKAPDCSPYSIEFAQLTYSRTLRDLSQPPAPDPARDWTLNDRQYPTLFRKQHDEARATLFMCNVEVNPCAEQKMDLEHAREFDGSQQRIDALEAELALCMGGIKPRY